MMFFPLNLPRLIVRRLAPVAVVVGGGLWLYRHEQVPQVALLPAALVGLLLFAVARRRGVSLRLSGLLAAAGVGLMVWAPGAFAALLGLLILVAGGLTFVGIRVWERREPRR